MDEHDEDPAPRTAIELWELLSGVVGRVERTADRKLGDIGLSLTDVLVMRLVDREPGVTQAAIARGRHQTESAASQAVTRLEQGGHVERTVDGRRRPLRLTRAGRTTLHDAASRLERGLTAEFGRLTTSERSELGRLLALLSTKPHPPDR